MTKTLCIYHGNRADGFGAAWCVREAFGADNVDFHAGVYQDLPPDVTGRDVIIVDFSYKRPVLDEMAQAAASIVILDHHKTAAEDLAPFQVHECGSGRFAFSDLPSVWRDFDELNRPFIAALFDMERSGAGLAWDFFFPRKPRPRLIDHIEDRDLWRFKLEGTREIQAALFSYPYDFEVWDKFFYGVTGVADESVPLEDLRREGAAIERKHHKDVAELVDVCKRPMKIGGHVVPAASLPYTLTSDAGHLMAKGQPFAACYWDTPEGRVFSLRSTDEGLDVSAIAKSYGGGGHRNASGFRVPLDQLDQFDPPPYLRAKRGRDDDVL